MENYEKYCPDYFGTHRYVVSIEYLRHDNCFGTPKQWTTELVCTTRRPVESKEAAHALVDSYHELWGDRITLEDIKGFTCEPIAA